MSTNHLIVTKVLQVQEPSAIRLGLDRLEEDKLILAFGRWAEGQIKKWIDYARGVLLFVMIPGLPLISVMFSAQVLNALLLPFILVFVMKLATDRETMGSLASGPVLSAIGWTCTGLLILLSLVLVGTGLFGV